MDASQDIRAEILSVFDTRGDGPEPLTTSAVADALDRPAERVGHHLSTLSERGDLDDKQVGGSRIWWPTGPVDERPADGLDPSQRRRLDLFENIQYVANVGAWSYDIRADEGWGTDEVLRIHGQEPGSHVTPEESIEFYHPEDRPAIREAFERAVECHEPYDLELRLVDADGNHRWVRTRGQAQFEDGEAVRVHGTIQDITDRKEREAELEAERQFVQQALDALDDVFYVLDTDGTLRQWNEQVPETLGYAQSDLADANVVEFFPDDEHETVRDGVETVLSDGDATIEADLLTAGGERRPYEFNGTRLTDTDGNTTGIVGIGRDITDRKEREEELRRKSRAIEEAPVGVTITDPSRADNPMIYVNEQFEEITGYSDEEATGRNCRFLQGEETRPEQVAAMRRGIDDGVPVAVDLRNYRNDGTAFWNHVEIAPVRDDSGTITNYVGFQQDVTDRVERERALEKRERVLRELHAATWESYPPESETEIAEFIVAFVEKAFEFEYVSVKRFDEETGRLQPATRSSTVDRDGVLGPVGPESGPVWEAYRRGEARPFDNETLADGDGALGVPINQGLVVPVGNFGVVVAYATGENEFGDVDVDLIEVVAANAEATFQRLRSDSVRTELVEQLSVQQTRVDELRSVIDTIQATQHHLASSESRDELEAGLCEGLLDTNGVDFVWVGRPRGSDTDLRPTAWAGDGRGYLDAVETDGADGSLPAQRAADDRDLYSGPNISSLVMDEAWAKEALSADFRSVMSVPLVYDDVLYGVLTVYSREEGTFGQTYEQFFTNVGSLMVNYSRLLEHRYDASRRENVEIEFELSDSTYPLQRLASETASRIRLDTVAENMAAEIRVLVTVRDGDTRQVLDAASSVNSVVEAARFGDSDHCQLTLTVQKPFLASVVAKHGGELVYSMSEESHTRFRVKLPKTASRRPLLDSLSSRYGETEPVAQRQTDAARLPGIRRVADILTDRQYEILNAAYHGGYYETPRQVTGEDLAESFGISSPAIYNHLQAAHRTLLENVVEPASDISDERDGLNR